MSYLINRKAASRIECLHILCRYILNKFGTTKTFTLTDIKFNRNGDNIHKFCTLLKSTSGIKYCSYKESPLDDAGCILTNGINADTTKSKEVSNTVNALHALGFVKRIGSSCTLTENGKHFAETEYDSEEMLAIIRKAVLNYGPIIGVLYKIESLIDSNSQFISSKIPVGYPNTIEFVSTNGKQVKLSVGSEKDSNTRTRSCLLSWLITAGFIYPSDFGSYQGNGLPQILYRGYLNQKSRNSQKFIYVKTAGGKTKQFVVNRPLDYNNLTKLTSALREKGSKATRETTLNYESRIKNRRFAIIYMLNWAYNHQTTINVADIENLFLAHPDIFIVSHNNLKGTILSEIDIAFTSGIPYKIVSKNQDLQPMNGVNVQELSINVPDKLLKILKQTYPLNE